MKSYYQQGYVEITSTSNEWHKIITVGREEEPISFVLANTTKCSLIISI